MPLRPRALGNLVQLALVEARRRSGIGPDAGEVADALGLDAVVGADAHEDLFEQADVGDDSEFGSKAAQVEDGVGDQLSGAVEGDIAAAVDLVHLDAAGGEQLARGDDVGRTRVASQGDDRRMLDKEQDVGDASLLAQLDQCFLQAQSGRVIAVAEIEDANQVSRIQGFKASKLEPR